MHSMSIEIQVTKAQGYNWLGKIIFVLVLDNNYHSEIRKMSDAVKWNLSEW